MVTLPEAQQLHMYNALQVMPPAVELAPLPPATGPPPPPLPPPVPLPWSAAAGSMPWLLEELKLTTLYGATFEEYDIVTVDDLVSLGRDGMLSFLRELGVTWDHRDKIEQLAFSPRPCGASGGAYDPTFLRACRPLHVQHMGCENMGPLLYALVRFVKPGRVLEVGAGYTSLWLLQALSDNDAELEACAQSVAADGYQVATAEWMVAEGLPPLTRRLPQTTTATPATPSDAQSDALPPGDATPVIVPRSRMSTLHAIDDMGEAEGGNRGSAHMVCEIATQRGLRERLTLHEGDAYELADAAAWLASSADEPTAGGASGAAGAGASSRLSQPLSDRLGGSAEADRGEESFDMMWLDFGLGTGKRIDGFLDAWWPRLSVGGLLLMHSTLTNAVTRAWLETQREKLRPATGATDEAPVAAAVPDGAPCPKSAHLDAFETLSLLEPHKRYQNSVSIFQKRSDGWGEPLHTMYP